VVLHDVPIIDDVTVGPSEAIAALPVAPGLWGSPNGIPAYLKCLERGLS
jgi:hypothetical protein